MVHNIFKTNFKYIINNNINEDAMVGTVKKTLRLKYDKQKQNKTYPK